MPKEWTEITLLQTFHNADVQLNCNSAWLFGSLFTPATLLRSHTSNYLHAGVSTYGYDSFLLDNGHKQPSERSKLFITERDRWQIWQEIFHDLQHTWRGEMMGNGVGASGGWQERRKKSAWRPMWKRKMNSRKSFFPREAVLHSKYQRE